MIGLLFLLVAMIGMAIISLAVTVFTVFTGLDALSWGLVWKRMDWAELGVFLLLVVLAAFCWLVTAGLGHAAWTQF